MCESVQVEESALTTNLKDPLAKEEVGLKRPTTRPKKPGVALFEF